MDMQCAIDVFVRGFAFTMSFTHPYITERVGPVWRMHDGSRRRPKELRSEEFIAYDADPAVVDALAREHAASRFSICALRASDESDVPIRAGYKALGYRVATTERMFVHDLTVVAATDGPLPVVRVASVEEAERLANAARTRQILPAHLQQDPPVIRQYMAVDGDRPVGWVRSIATPLGAWCSNMYVEPEYRRRGAARSLLGRMLSDDRDAGAAASVLLASHAGARLYPSVGYRDIGECIVFTPARL